MVVDVINETYEVNIYIKKNNTKQSENVIIILNSLLNYESLQNNNIYIIDKLNNEYNSDNNIIYENYDIIFIVNNKTNNNLFSHDQSAFIKRCITKNNTFLIKKNIDIYKYNKKIIIAYDYTSFLGSDISKKINGVLCYINPKHIISNIKNIEKTSLDHIINNDTYVYIDELLYTKTEINKFKILSDNIYFNNMFSLDECIINIETIEEYKDEINNKNSNDITKYWCHLHCYNINNFQAYYGVIFKIIRKYFSVVVTYCIGNEKLFNHYIKCIKIQNKGMDVGAKIKFIEYLNKNNIEYEYVLMLHSKSNKLKRNQYFKPFYKLEDILKLLDGKIGAITPDLILQPSSSNELLNHCVNGVNIQKSSNWSRNSIHMENLIKLMDLPLYNCLFAEGNVYILHKDVAEFLYDDRFGLYDKLNDITTFDYSWFVNYYEKKDMNYNEAYDYYKSNNLYGNNLQVAGGDKQLRDCMIEHCFERLLFGVCKKLNKSVYIMGICEENNSFLNESIKLNDVPYIKKRVSIIACHTSSELKKISLLSIIDSVKNFSSTIYIINSSEFRGLIEETISNMEFIVLNNKLNSTMCKKFREKYLDLNCHSDEELNEHYNVYGIKENRYIYGQINVFISYVDNDKYVCYGKYESVLNNLKDIYDEFLLTNDSIYIINNIDFNTINTMLQNGIEMISMCESNEIKYHHPDFFRVYNKNGMYKWLKHFNDNKHNINTFNDCVKLIEIETTYITDKRDTLFNLDEFKNFNGNQHFDDTINEYFLTKLKYPIIKIKKLYTNKYYDNNIPYDFDEKQYLEMNGDLKGLNIDLRKHFADHGIKEGRLYKKDQKICNPIYLTPFLKKLLNKTVINNKFSGISHIVWINLERAPERRINMENNFENLDIKNTRITAIDGKYEDVINMISPIKTHITDLEIACVLSHIKAISFLSKLEGEYFLVCEDDIHLNNIMLVNGNINSIIKNAPPFDILLLHKLIHNHTYLGMFDNTLYKYYSEIISEKKIVYSTAGYIISKKGIEKILSKISFCFEKNKFIINDNTIGVADKYLYHICNTLVYKYNFLDTLNETSYIHPENIKLHKKSSILLIDDIIKQYS